MDLTPFIKKTDTKPVYLQLYHYFREEIEQARLLAGTKLPSIRQLSEHLHISKNTVETAYQQLVAEGYIESREKSGLFVIELDDFKLIKNDMNIQEYKQTSKQGKDKWIDFQYGDIELDRFPYKTWKKCLTEAVDHANQEVFSYGNKQGHSGLRTEISSYLYQARGVRCSPEQILLCAGTQTAISFICQLLKLPNEKVAIENPGYDGVRFVFERHKCQLMPISLEPDGICLDDLAKSSAKCVYVTPSHQFPLGMVLPIQKRQKLLQWAERNDSYIIEDDYDGEFRYQGQPIPSLKSLDTNERVIYLGTFSKAFLPAARVTYIVLPEILIQSFRSELSFYNQTVSPLIQEAVYRFMKEDHFGRHIRKMRKIYQKKQQVLLDTIDRYLGSRVSVIGQKAGLHLLLDLKGINSNELITRAKNLGVKIYATDKFWLGCHPGLSQPIMIGFGGLDEKEIETGIMYLANVVEGMDKGDFPIQ